MRKTNLKLLSAAAALAAVMPFAASAEQKQGFYLGAGVGYGISTGGSLIGTTKDQNAAAEVAPSTVDRGFYKNGEGMNTEVEAGYNFADFRAGVVVNYAPKMKRKADLAQLENRELGGSLRVAYDFETNCELKPFVFGDVGAVRVKAKIKPYQSPEQKASDEVFGTVGADATVAPTNQVTSIDSKAKTVFKYGAGFGLGYEVERCRIDLTYGIGRKAQYALDQIPVAQNTSAAGAAANWVGQNINVKVKNAIDHSLSLGLKFQM